MRHRLSGRQLSRNAPHRHALMRNLSVALLRHETIRTTVPKAKELRRVVEPLITLGKTDSEARRRLAFARLRDAAIVELSAHQKLDRLDAFGNVENGALDLIVLLRERFDLTENAARARGRALDRGEPLFLNLAGRRIALHAT